MSDSKINSLEEILPESFSIDFEQVEQVSRVFFEESKEILGDLDNMILRLENEPGDMEHLNILFRKVHTIKGSVGAVPGGQLMGSLAHEFEALLLSLKHGHYPANKECIDLFLKSSRILKVLSIALKEKRELYPEELSEAIEIIACYGSFKIFQSSDTQQLTSATQNPVELVEEGVWISKKQFDRFVDLAGELLVMKNFFQMVQQTVNFRLQPDLYERRQNDFAQNLSKICDQFQNQVQAVRKEKVYDSFGELAVLARQTSAELNKNVQLEILGGDLLIDKVLGKDLNQALVHIVRNSIDHGIEDQLERAIQGKPPAGSLILEVEEKNSRLQVTYKDDGKGLDSNKILQKVLESGIVSQETASKLTDDEIYRFIFNVGFSTKEKVTTMSGRGVGMDVVNAVIEKYHGSISIENAPGHGVCFRMELPIPQNIMVESVLLCSWKEFKFAIPLSSVVHISSCNELQFTTVNQLRYCQFNGFTVSLLNYQEMLNLKTLTDEKSVGMSAAIFIKAHDSVFALMVDKVEAKTDLVVKPFGKIIDRQSGSKGVSILADENIAYILDPEKMMALFSKSATASDQEAA